MSATSMKAPEEELSDITIQPSKERRGSGASAKPDKKERKEKKDAEGSTLTPKKEKKSKGTGRVKKQASALNVQATTEQADGSDALQL